MVVFINNLKRDLDGTTSIADLLNILQIEKTRGLALAVNNQVVPKVDWNTFSFQENDHVTIIRATQGG